MKMHGQGKGKQRGVIVGYHELPIDYEVVKKVGEATGIAENIIEKSVLTNRNNKLTTFYHLMLKKKVRKGEYSPGDISHKDFIP